MITAVLAWTAGIAFSLGMLIGGWAGADWWGTKREAKGFAAGVADERSRDEEKMKTLTARLEADGLALQKKESDRAREIDRIRQAASDAARLEYAEAADAAALNLGHALTRLRVAEARGQNRRANSCNGVPEAARAAAGSPQLPGDRAWVLSEAGREEDLRDGAFADRVAAALALCRAANPNPVSPP